MITKKCTKICLVTLLLSSFSLVFINRKEDIKINRLLSSSSYFYFKEVDSYQDVINGVIKDDLLLVSNYTYNSSYYYFDSFVSKKEFVLDSYNGFFANQSSILSIVDNQKLKINDKYLYINTFINESNNLSVTLEEVDSKLNATAFNYSSSSKYITFYYQDNNQASLDSNYPYLALYYDQNCGSLSYLKAGGVIGKKYGFKLFHKVDVNYTSLDFVNWINNDDNFLNYECVDKYLSAKDIIIKMDKAQLDTLINNSEISYINARNRYEAWCKANDDYYPYS